MTSRQPPTDFSEFVQIFRIVVRSLREFALGRTSGILFGNSCILDLLLTSRAGARVGVGAIYLCSEHSASGVSSPVVLYESSEQTVSQILAHSHLLAALRLHPGCTVRVAQCPTIRAEAP